MYDHLSDEELMVLIDALETTLKHEGGLVDHPDDPGVFLLNDGNTMGTLKFIF